MDFLNPIALIFSLSLASMNLYHLDERMAENLSATYSLERISEGFELDKCPNAFTIEIDTSDQPDVFFLKRESHFQNFNAQPRILLVDGKPHLLHDGEIIKASVFDDRSLQIEIFNETLPNEKIVETMVFNNDGSMNYKAHLEDDTKSQKVELCQDSTYLKN